MLGFTLETDGLLISRSIQTVLSSAWQLRGHGDRAGWIFCLDLHPPPNTSGTSLALQ